jgi:hypothetical protein
MVYNNYFGALLWLFEENNSILENIVITDEGNFLILARSVCMYGPNKTHIQ